MNEDANLSCFFDSACVFFRSIDIAVYAFDITIRYWYSEEQGLVYNGYIESIHGNVDRSEEDASTVEKAREICIFVQGWDPLAGGEDEDEDEMDAIDAEA